MAGYVEGFRFRGWGRAALGADGRGARPHTCLLLEQRDLPGVGLSTFAAAVRGSYYCQHND